MQRSRRRLIEKPWKKEPAGSRLTSSEHYACVCIPMQSPCLGDLISLLLISAAPQCTH